MKTMRTLLMIGMLFLLLAACGGGEEEEPPAAPAVATEAPASEPTAAPAPTEAPAAPTAVPTEPPAEATAAPEEPAAAPDVAASSGDAHDTVMNAMRQQLAGGPYRTISTIETEGTTTEMTVEMIPPDQIHAIIGAAEGTTEMILVNGTTWFKSGDTPWMQMPGGEMVDAMLASVQSNVEETVLSNVQFVGTESVNGEAAQVYTFTSSFGVGDQQITSDTKLWISEASGLPVKIEATGVAMGITSHTVQTIEYDDNITIEAPQ